MNLDVLTSWIKDVRGKANLDSTKQLRAARLWTVEKMSDGGDGVNLHPGENSDQVNF